jgi:hypothetical protein
MLPVRGGASVGVMTFSLTELQAELEALYATASTVLLTNTKQFSLQKCIAL